MQDDDRQGVRGHAFVYEPSFQDQDYNDEGGNGKRDVQLAQNGTNNRASQMNIDEDDDDDDDQEPPVNHNGDGALATPANKSNASHHPLNRTRLILLNVQVLDWLVRVPKFGWNHAIPNCNYNDNKNNNSNNNNNRIQTNVPIQVQYVFLIGTVVSVRIRSLKKNNRILELLLDDGSAVLQCACWLTTAEGQPRRIIRPALGDIVRVCAQLNMPPKRAANDSRFAGRGVIAQSIQIVTDPNEQTYHWLQAVHLWRTQYRDANLD